MMSRRDHLLNGWTQTTTSSKHGCAGRGSSWSSSFAVGIQKERRPESTMVSLAKWRMSRRMSGRLYGFLGGMKVGSLVSH